ncbi:ComF family protein [Flavobacterium rhizosphaerae]|uniref:ComF family protein n=1 Tax=Flavobacterium rhizosphaerae TaxID=3163298 RepID=A0ABW8YYJ3_9FLAO
MLKSLINLLYPEHCNGCNSQLLETEAVLCIQCRHELPFTHQCINPENEIAKRLSGRLPLEHASSLLYFHKQGMVQQMVHNLKYRGRQEVGKLAGQLYAAELKNAGVLQTVNEIIPVPLHPKRLRERGYNQVTEFGRALSAGLDISYNEKLLLRTAYTKTQTKKNLEARAGIIGSAFEVKATEKDYNKHFLLIDDVITTGATLESCGRLLLSIPGAKLSIVTIAYTE